MALNAVEARRTSSGPLTGAATLVSPAPSARAAPGELRERASDLARDQSRADADCDHRDETRR